MDKNSIVKFSEFLASKKYVATVKPDFGQDGVESVSGFANIFWDEDDVPYTVNFNTIKETYQEFLESIFS